MRLRRKQLVTKVGGTLRLPENRLSKRFEPFCNLCNQARKHTCSEVVRIYSCANSLRIDAS